MTDTNQLHEELTWEEMAPWLEFACWFALFLAPILYYVNGPSVSHDQFVVRTGLVVLSGVGGVVLRIVNWRRSRRAALLQNVPRPAATESDRPE